MSFLAALTVGSGLMSAYGQYKQGQDAAKASSYNASIYDQQAQQIRESAALDVEMGERNKASFLSTQKAGYVFRGVKISGSPLLVMANNATNLEADIRTTEYNALIGASRASSAAAMERLNASNAKRAGLIAAGATLLKTAVSANNFTAGSNKSPAGTSQPPIGYQQKNKAGLLVSRY